VGSDGAVDVLGGGIGDELDVEPRELADGIAFTRNVSRPVQITSTLAGGVSVPSLGSATTSETFFSSLTESRRLARRGVTLPSMIAATSSRAVAALSNF